MVVNLEFFVAPQSRAPKVRYLERDGKEGDTTRHVLRNIIDKTIEDFTIGVSSSRNRRELPVRSTPTFLTNRKVIVCEAHNYW